MLLATSLLTTAVLFASPTLEISQVAPEQTVLTVSIDNMGELLDRIKNSPGGIHLKKLNEIKDEVGEGMPQYLQDSWEEMLEDQSLVEVLGSFNMGLAVFPVVDAETTAVSMGLSTYVGLGSAKDLVDEVWEEAMESLEQEEESFELLEMSDVEVVRIAPGELDADDMDDDAFGGGGGFMAMMSIEDAVPDRFYLAHHQSHVLVSTSRSQMQRMIDLLNGEEVEGGLSKSESWEGVSEFIGKKGLRVMLLTDHLGEMAKSLGQPFMVDMARPMISAILGRIDGIGFAFTAAEAPALATYRMGVFMPEGKAGLMKLLSRNAAREPIPGWVAADATSYSRFTFDTAGVMPWLKSVINSNPMLSMQGNQMMEQVEPMMEKVLAGMGDTVRMTSSISYPLSADSNQSLIAISARDGKEFTDALAEMGPQMGMEPRDFQGHQIYSMEMAGGMMPGVSIPEMGIAVGGDQIFIGSMSGVEQALRSIGQRPDEAVSSTTGFAAMEPFFSGEPVAMWNVSKMGETMRASAEISQMQMKAQLAEIYADDPELGEELEDMYDSESPGVLADIASQIIGMVGYEVVSVDRGFRLNGWVLPVTE